MTNKAESESEASNLYNVSIKILELSSDAVDLITQTGMESVGDCLDYFLRAHDAMITVRPSIIEIMETEVKDKLIQQGYLGSGRKYP